MFTSRLIQPTLRCFRPNSENPDWLLCTRRPPINCGYMRTSGSAIITTAYRRPFFVSEKGTHLHYATVRRTFTASRVLLEFATIVTRPARASTGYVTYSQWS